MSPTLFLISALGTGILGIRLLDRLLDRDNPVFKGEVGWSRHTRFRKIDKADDSFTRQVRACRPMPALLPAPVPLSGASAPVAVVPPNAFRAGAAAVGWGEGR